MMPVGTRTVGFALATLIVSLVFFDAAPSAVSAQNGSVWHEVVSWNDNSTVTAEVSVRLPSKFADAKESAKAWVVCGEPKLCHKATVSIDDSSNAGLLGGFEMAFSPGDNPISVLVTATGADGVEIKHQVPDYVAVVPAPQPLQLDYLHSEITELRDDGTADVRLAFSAVHQDNWPMYSFSAIAACEDGTDCSGEVDVIPGWWDTYKPGTPRQSEVPHLVYLTLAGLEQGERTLSIEARDSDSRWLGSPRVTRLTDITVSIPVAESIDAEFLRSEVTGYNGDLTADLTLEFLIKPNDSWPFTSIAVSVVCTGEAECEYEHALYPGWVYRQNADGTIVQFMLDSVPVGEVNMSAKFTLSQQGWTAPERSTTLDAFLTSVPSQPEIDVRWRVDSSEVVGYHMDGSALVNLTLTVQDLGYGDGFAGQASGYCFEDDDASECNDFKLASQIQVGQEESTIVLSGFKLPQGESVIRIVAGEASGSVSVQVPHRSVGISRDLWDCFYETEVTSGETCGGFNEPIVQKWMMESVNVYREGDPLYVEIFDSVLDTISEITGIDYVIVDSWIPAQVEAYLGHKGHPRAVRIFGEACAHGPGCAFHFSNPESPHELKGARITVGKRQPDWRDEAITLEEEIRFTTLHEAFHALIPVGHDSRPFAPSLVEKPSYMRQSDTLMYRMIYTPGVAPGMSFDELREFVVLDDETLDYVPSPPLPDVQISRTVSKTIGRLYDAGSISLKLTGMDVQGSVRFPGPTLDVQYAGFTGSRSEMVKFASRSWKSIIFGYDAESWSSAGGIWTISGDHAGRARNYRGHVKFDFILADPVPLLRYHLFAADRLQHVKRGDGTFAIRNTSVEAEGEWPRPSVEVVIDQESGEMRSYAVEWQFEPNSRYRYRVQTDVVSYGDEFEIPDLVREQSLYLEQVQ